MEEKNSEVLLRAAHKASDSPEFVGWSLVKYQSSNQVDDEALAGLLGCSATQIARLALCRSPREERGRFGPDIERIAAYAGCDADRLTRILREAAALHALGDKADSASQGTLMAARDRQDLGSGDDLDTPAADRDKTVR